MNIGYSIQKRDILVNLDFALGLSRLRETYMQAFIAISAYLLVNSMSFVNGNKQVKLLETLGLFMHRSRMFKAKKQKTNGGVLMSFIFRTPHKKKRSKSFFDLDKR